MDSDTELVKKLSDIEDLLSEMIQDEQGKCEDAAGISIVYPEDAAPDLDSARSNVQDAIESINQHVGIQP